MTEQAIEDDPELLALFLADMESQSELWRPTSYWSSHCERIQQQLARSGLRAFRRNWNLMRGVDLGFKHTELPQLTSPVSAGSRIIERIPPFKGFRDRHDALVERIRDEWNRTLDQHVQREAALFYELLKSGQMSGRLLSAVDDSCVGHPHSFRLDDRYFTSNLLHHVCLYSIALQAAHTTDFARVVEIGGGYGALPELWAKAGGGARDGYFVEIDIPPLVYVTTQYLKAILPDRVIDYREVRRASKITASDLRGKILVIPPWVVPALDIECDLLWNSISFQEMERDVVVNYMAHASKWAQSMFINTRTEGHRPGLGGQKEPIGFSWIAERLADHGYAPAACDEGSTEWAAFRAVLPQHSVGFFTKSARALHLHV